MNNIRKTYELGQSIWLDYIRRSFLLSGDLGELIGMGLAGMTSNPTIFEKAITGSSDYDADLRDMAVSGKSIEEIYDALTRKDIALAADLLRPVYEATDRADGFVSLEVNPLMAADTQSTIREGVRLFRSLERPNVMIKVPATPEGRGAIEALIAEGINVNVTLIFSLDQYRMAADAYISGLRKLIAGGGDPAGIASVASFFVSRVDTVVDGKLEEIGLSEPQGKTAIANVKLAYKEFKRIFSGPVWEELSSKGARVQRPLWASTGTKNPAYPDTLYVDDLIGPDTVNTLPTATLHAFIDHGTVSQTLEKGVHEASEHLENIRRLGINIDTVTGTLLEKGVESFSDSFRSLMDGIALKYDELMGHEEAITFRLGPWSNIVKGALGSLKKDRVMARIWDHDHTVWKPEPDEITNRLGWLDSPDNMSGVVPQIVDVVNHVREAGYTRALLLGMGGSSLAPEVFRETFGVADGYPDLSVLDSTDPAAVIEQAKVHDPAKTLFVVSTKSGTTAETLSFLKYFYKRTVDTVGSDRAGEHFIAITDPESPLEKTAREYDFRHVFINDPNIGGRYSALSYFGLVPAALVGVDLPALLERARTLAVNCEAANCPVDGDNSGAKLGAVMGELSKHGVDKLTVLTSPAISIFGAWLEQLLAESTGKEGKGILPVVAETPGPMDVYGKDRLFAYLRLQGDDTHDDLVDDLVANGHPVCRINLKDIYDMGGEFFRWEMATAVAGHIMGINPFDQPNVESAKIQARRMLDEYGKTGKLPEAEPLLETDGITVYSDLKGNEIDEIINSFLSQAGPDNYAAIQAYINPATEASSALNILRLKIRDRLKIAATLGFGPRFLHSTGQIHKGDGGKGLFIQITAEDIMDIPIPDELGSSTSDVSFGILKATQAMGDRQALLDAGRRVIRFHITGDITAGINRITESIL